MEIKNHNGKYFFEIEVEKYVIRQYGLENVVWNSHSVNNPVMYHNAQDLKNEGSIVHQFTISPYTTAHSEEYYQFIQAQYNKMVNGIEEKHRGNLLFLSYTYFLGHQEKQTLIANENHLRIKGKLLLDLIRVPIPLLNKDNVYNAFRGYPYFETPEPDAKGNTDIEHITHRIISYLTLISGQKEEYFLKDGKIDFSKIKPRLWTELTTAINKTCSIPIIIQEKNIERNQEEKVLYISQDVIIKFQAKRNKANNPLLLAEQDYQNRQLIQVIAQHLLNEQKEHNTEFYRAMLDFDFSMPKNFKALSATVGDYYKTHHLYNLSKVYLALIQYLKEHELLKGDTNPNTNRLRSNFIYQYFILLGLTQTDDKGESKGELKGYNSLSDLKKEIEPVQKKLSAVNNTYQKRFAVIKMRNDLKGYLPKM